jgi:hypothetical protein
MSNTNIKKVGAAKISQNLLKHAWDCVSFDHQKQSILSDTPYSRLFVNFHLRETNTIPKDSFRFFLSPLVGDG